MSEINMKTPLGTAVISGDENGISSITIFDDEREISPVIPDELQEAYQQLQDYFNGKRIDFTFKLNPSGTEFQKRVWQGLLEFPLEKQCHIKNFRLN